MRPSQDWNALIQKHLDGQTTEEEAQALSTGIEDDAEVRSQYLKAAQIHGALADETLALGVESEPEVKAAAPEQQKVLGQFAWPRQIAAGLVAGMFVGLLGVGMPTPSSPTNIPATKPAAIWRGQANCPSTFCCSGAAAFTSGSDSTPKASVSSANAPCICAALRYCDRTSASSSIPVERACASSSVV